MGELTAGDLSALLTLLDFERAADAVPDAASWAYVVGGADAQVTVRANVEAFDQVWLRPRTLGSASDKPDTSVTVFEQRLALPVLLAPTSPRRLLHDDAEIATARAAEATGTVSIVSTDRHHAFPEAAGSVGSDCWFQLYAYRSREDVAATIPLAEEAGATAAGGDRRCQLCGSPDHHPASRLPYPRPRRLRPPALARNSDRRDRRSSAWICDFSSTYRTTARSGGSRYRPTTSRTLSVNRGSLDSLKVSTRCGSGPKVRQIRPGAE